MKKTTSTFLALAATAAIALTGCTGGGAQSGADSDQSASADAAATQEEEAPEVDRSGDGPFPSVSGDAPAAPTIAKGEGEQPTDKIYAKTLSKGSGAKVTVNDVVAVNYSGVLWDGTQFDSSWKDGKASPIVFGLNNVIKGWKYGLADQKVGDRVELVIPSTWAYGSEATNTIPADSTLTFVVDILGTIDGTDTSALKEAKKTDAKLPEGLTVEGDLGDEAKISIKEGAKLPTSNDPVVIAEGKGKTITAEDYVVYQGVASLWSDPSQMQSTWTEGGAQLVQPGATEMVGQKVGTRMLLVYVPEDAAAQSGQAQAQVMLVDIVGAMTADGK